MKKILIIKTSAIGDVIQTFPVVEYLRNRFPDSQIDWVVEKSCASLLTAHPYVNKVLIVDTKKWRKNISRKEVQKEIKFFFTNLRDNKYDFLFDLQGNTKSALITFSAKSKEKIGFGLRSVPEVLNVLATNIRYNISKEINVRHRYLQVVQKFLKDEEKEFIPSKVILKIFEKDEIKLKEVLHGLADPIYMICFGSKWRNKQLSDETLIAYLKKLEQKKNPSYIFIYGNEEEEIVAKRLESIFPSRSKAVGKLSLPLWQALMAKVSLVIAMDSAALHLCGTTSTPSFSFFGPSKSHIYKPLGDHHRSFQGVCPYNKKFVHRCSNLRSCSTGACMRDLNINEIIAFQDKMPTSSK